MSLPPETITVRRKRRAGADDGPVNFLRVEETKRQRSGTWLYRRKEPVVESSEPTTESRPQDGRPIIHSSRPGDEKIPLNALSGTALAHRPAQDVYLPTSPSPPTSAPPASGPTEPRRFHLSRFNNPDRSSSGSSNKRSRFASALFVERTGKRKAHDISAAEQPGIEDLEPQDIEMGDAAPRQLKRPGAGSRIAKAQTTPEKKPPRLPPSLRNRQYDENMDSISRDMNSYILEQIGHNLAQLDEQKAKLPPTHATPTKYRPKAPAKRFAERHPEAASPEKGKEDVDMDDGETEDEDYVVETYVRVPAHLLAVSVPTEQVGLLVFEHETDIEFFYGAEDDSEEEYLEDDEDSNAEDYYTADYPEDEVESDDEYGRDDYHYRTGNASDMEEFDKVAEDDIAKSDDENGLSVTQPWKRRTKIRSGLGLPGL